MNLAKGGKSPFSGAAKLSPNGIVAFCNASETAYQNEKRGKYLIAPYGDHLNGGYTQRIDEKAVGLLIYDLSSNWKKIRNIFGNACPVYMEHPDQEENALNPANTDKTPYGKVRSLEFGDDGAYADIEWLRGFEDLPKSLQFSPRWSCEDLGDKVVRPFRLLSIGLTHSPAIKGTAFANSENLTQQQKEIDMLEGILKALGLSAEATPQEAEEKIKALLAKIGEAEKDKGEGDKKSQELESELEEQKKETLANSNLFKAERTAHINLVVANAVRDGKITFAQKETTATLLANSEDFAKAVESIDGLAPVLKTQSETDGIEKQEKAKEKSRTEAQAEFMKLVKETEAKGMSYQEAWDSAKQGKKELYEKAYL